MIGHSVFPIKDCPHCLSENLPALQDFKVAAKITNPCKQCGDTSENWICLKCLEIFCSRYVKEHMVAHYEQIKHPLALSFSDLSFWCYDCNNYVESQKFNGITKAIYAEKFGEASQADAVKQLEKEFQEKLKLNPEGEEKPKDQQGSETDVSSQQEEEEKKDKYTFEDLGDDLRNMKFKKVAVLTGAGISVNAGIPDFRSPKTGLYATLKQSHPDLGRPEDLFTINYFLENPQPFYDFAQHFDIDKYNPTATHFFIKLLEDKKILQMNLTQNIDGLEYKAGVNPLNIIAAHGHTRSAHCAKLDCSTEVSIDKYRESLKKKEVLRCEKCNSPVKPDIVFFGEALPEIFLKKAFEVSKCDLMIVMGTSLMVAPFNSLVYMVEKGTPMVLINKDPTETFDFQKPEEKRLFIGGDCDESVRKLCKAAGWEKELDELISNFKKDQKKQ